MFTFLKQIFLWLYFGYGRASKRKAFIDKVSSKTKKRKFVEEIPHLRTVLDEVSDLPENVEDNVTFVAFDKSGNALALNVQRLWDGKEIIHLDINLPGHGQFKYREILHNKENNFVENICGSRRLKLCCLQPMRRWRMFFRGPMKNATVDSELIHLTLSAYWHCLSDPYDHLTSSSSWVLAGNLSKLSWKDLLTPRYSQDQLSYEQLGEIRVRICIVGKELNFRLKCIKERTLRMIKCESFQIVQRQYVVMDRTGLFLSFQAMSVGKGDEIPLGYVLFPIGDFSPTRQEEQKSRLDHISVVKACGNTYKVSETLKRFVFKNYVSNFHFGTFSVSDKPAFGITSYTDRSLERGDIEIECRIHEFYNPRNELDIDEEIMAVSFEEPPCTFRTLVGGKGSQLAVLKSLGICSVPKGFCLTSNAYRKHIQDNQQLDIATGEITDCIKYGKLGNLKKACEKAVDIFEKIPLSDDLQTSIKELLDKIFTDEKYSTKSFAIRSSSISEDGYQASSAGQLDTFLGIYGFESICDSIRKCWASSVSYRVVEYRRQNGQRHFENMGVVIQEMIDSDVAGVLFTNHPVDGDETKIVINASYGLGEVVVSGKVIPDTIIVRRGESKGFKIEPITVGEKKFRIAVDSAVGTTEVSNADEDRGRVCLRQNEIESLCEISVAIENKLNYPQDIEWAMQNDDVFILQTRPITAIYTETNEEIIHEFDTPVISDIELITPCNVQEAIPGATSTLCTDVHLPAVDRSSKYNAFSRLGLKYPIHVSKITLSFGGLALFGVTPIMPLITHGLAGEKAKSNAEFNILGMSVNEQTVETINEFYGRSTSKTRKLINAAKEYFILRRRDSALYEQIKQKVATLKIGEKALTSKALYKAINDNLYLYYEMWRAMVFVTAKSSMQTAVMMSVLKGSNSEMTVENTADIALLLSQCKNVLSAEIPNDINSLAKLIANSDRRETFLRLPLAECDSFLRAVDLNELHMKYIQFMERHGHRCIKESDFFEKTWSQEPTKLMKILKTVVQQSKFQTREKPRMPIDELVDNLKTPMSPFKKKLMKRILVKNAMEGVAEREQAKSFAMKACAIFKNAYWRLARLMVNEGRLPDENLMFFMTHREIGIVIENRSIDIIRLAKRRLKLLPEMDKARYNKVNIGFPKPAENKAEQVSGAFITLRGMPVCRGNTSGRACVIQTLDDADQIHQGDILICLYTDVGWSPYFPLINGLVTELGGLISHGAVIARENGIPCVVNVTSATELFKTGDSVIVDGTAGTISKVQS